MVILVFHDLLQFVLESQGGFGRNPDGPGQIERGDAVLGLGDQVDGQHPGGQGQFGRGEDGALGQRGLETTSPTLVQLATLQGIAVLVAAFRALEAPGPAHFKQGLLALFFCAVGCEESWQAEPFLKLNFVFRHGELC